MGGGKDISRIAYISQVGHAGHAAAGAMHGCALPRVPPTIRLDGAAQPHPARPHPTPRRQVKARPPTFVAWASGSTPLPVATRRFLTAQIRAAFDFQGVPLRILVRQKAPRRERQQGRRR